MRNALALLLMALMAAASCSDDDDDDNDVTTANDDDDDDTTDPEPADAFVVTTDFETGGFALVTPGTFATDLRPGTVHADAVPRQDGDLIAVVNRFGGDNIQWLDPADDFATVAQYSTGNGSNPQDFVRVAPDRAYVSRYEMTELLVMDTETGETVATIDFSSLADADGIPEMGSMLRLGDKVLVTVARVNRNDFFNPTDASYLSVIDIATGTLERHVVLAATNPVEMGYLPATNQVWVSLVGFFGMPDGGVELLDADTLESAGLALSEEALGGDIGESVWMEDGKGYAIYSDPAFNTLLAYMDLGTGTKIRDIYTPAGFVLAGMAISPDGYLWVGDRTAGNPGVRLFLAENGAPHTEGAINTGLPPFKVMFMQ